MPESSIAAALRTNGFRPRIGASTPAPVNSPHLMRSRRDTRPHDSSRTISTRFRRARSAAWTRALDAFPDRYIRLMALYSFHSLEQQSPRSRPHDRRAGTPPSTRRQPTKGEALSGESIAEGYERARARQGLPRVTRSVTQAAHVGKRSHFP